MNIILTSDLHRDGAKLLWLLDEAPQHNALLVAGDLLDIFSNTVMSDQTSGALRWRDAYLKSGKSLAWCSGNHDFYHGDHTPTSEASPLWMREIPSSSTYLTDGESRLLDVGLEKVAVTTLPWPVSDGEFVIGGTRINYLDFVRDLLRAGRKLQTEETPWIVLFHEPPEGTPVAATYSAMEADFTRRTIEAAKPDFSLHGHIHQAPTAKGGSWNAQLGPTVCFNAGQSLPGEPLHHILLEWRSRNDWTATWSGAGQSLQIKSE